MKKLANILLMLLAVISVGCNTTKKSVQSTVVIQDTSATTKEVKVITGNDAFRSRTEKDTAVGIKGASLKDTVKAVDMELPRTKAGKAVPRNWSKYQDGVKIWATLDTLGNLQYGADVDSITFIIKGLIRDSINIHRRYDSLADVYKEKYSSAVVVQETTKVITPTWWGRNWRMVIAAVVGAIILIVVFVLSGYLKRGANNPFGS